MVIELEINNQKCDIDQEINIVLDRVVSEYRNPLKKVGSYTYDLTLPVTQKNKGIFRNENDIQVVGKFRTKLPARILVNDVELISGFWYPDAYTSEGFQGSVIGNNNADELRISDIILEDSKLQDIQSFKPLPFYGDVTVFDALDDDMSNQEVCYPYVANSLFRLAPVSTKNNPFNYKLSYEDFGINHFTKDIVKNIFKDAGYTVEGEILKDDAWKKMVMLYSNESEEEAYNYGTLNPLRSTGGVYEILEYNENLAYKGYYVYLVQPVYGQVWTPSLVGTNQYLKERQVEGDFSNSLSAGVYYCKHTGFYEMDYKTSIYVKNKHGVIITHKAVAVFREITDSLMVDINFDKVSYANFNEGTFKDIDQNIIHIGNSGDTFTCKLEKGKQYAVQIYVAVSKEQGVAQDTLDIPHTSISANTFNITKCSGPKEINPAKFLPSMTQHEFLNGIFKIFNLYYVIDGNTKTVTLYTRNEFYERNKENLINIDGYCDVKQFKETPLSEANILDVHFNWTKDANDYLHMNTDYLQKVNNPNLPDRIYELPFSALGFMRVPVKNKDGDTNHILIGCKIPQSEVVDKMLLSDLSVENGRHTLKPKMCLYHGTMIKEVLNNPNSSNFQANNLFITFDSKHYKPVPIISFMNLKDQVAYEIQIKEDTREFYLTGATTGATTIFNPGDTKFIINKNLVQDADTISLGNTDNKSVFRNQYQDNLRINNYSNYTEGLIKMNSVLYSRMNGRNIIQAQNNLYFLESITGYEPKEGQAKIKLYKLV